MTKRFGTTHFVPFSSMHKYQRTDSIWADAYTTNVADYAINFDPKIATLLPAFIRYDCLTDRYEEIRPPEKVIRARDPKEFGDDWDDELEPKDVAELSEYFRSIEHLGSHFDFITFRVGGKENAISLAKRKFETGIIFEVPRASLMTAVGIETFDDLLIGNFMKTTLHGLRSLYPHFTPYVAKYADNGRAKTEADVKRYFREYLRRAPLEYLRDRFERRSRDVVRSVVSMDSGLYKIVKGGYHKLKGW
jgi:hypothetical protein